MRSLIWSLVPLLTVFSNAAVLGGECYKHEVYFDRPAPKDDVLLIPSEGRRMTPAEAQTVDAAIDMIYEWEENCGLEPPLPQGVLLPGQSEHFASAQLTQLLINGNICVDTVTRNSDGSSSRGNFQVSQSTTEGGTATLTMSGHPGININADMVPTSNPEAVAHLGFTLLHELYHVNDTSTHGQLLSEAAQALGEAAAWTYTATEACKVAGCESASEEEMSAACDAIVQANYNICRANQVDGVDVSPLVCQYCADSFGSVHCETEAVITRGFDFERYKSPYYTGWIVLHVGSRLFQTVFYPVGGVGSQRSLIDLTTFPGLDSLIMTSFTILDDTTMLVGGFDINTSEGLLLEVGFAPSTGGNISVDYMYRGHGLQTVTDLSLFMESNRVAVLDAAAESVFVFDRDTSALTLIADATNHPELTEGRYVQDEREYRPLHSEGGLSGGGGGGAPGGQGGGSGGGGGGALGGAGGSSGASPTSLSPDWIRVMSRPSVADFPWGELWLIDENGNGIYEDVVYVEAQ